MKTLSIILPSFRDSRVTTAIQSIRMFDDVSTVRIIVIDGGSDEALVGSIQRLLTNEDILISERDEGIFDALNKGLERVDTPYVGWLGSDDLYSGEVRASKVIDALKTNEIFVASLYITAGTRIRRLTRSVFAAKGLTKYGLHNPHYSTFGHASLFCAHRFDIKSISADIGYFLDVFSGSPRILHTEKVATLQEEGGFSTGSVGRSITINRAAFEHYRERSNAVTALLSVFLKMGYKVISRVRYSVFPRHWDKQFPSAANILAPASKK